jgi:16S rRNA G966 N2-methylase RsmD
MPAENKLYYGDNLDILRNHHYFPDGCVDLIYLDPPFNSSRSYNVRLRIPGTGGRPPRKPIMIW